jgi:hypothetical protein
MLKRQSPSLSHSLQRPLRACNKVEKLSCNAIALLLG